jgi:hypothetical protein
MLEETLSVAHHDLMGDIEMNFTDTESNQRGFLMFWAMENRSRFRKNQFAKSH